MWNPTIFLGLHVQCLLCCLINLLFVKNKMQWISKLRSGTFLGCPGALFKAPVTLGKIPFSSLGVEVT